MFERVESVVIGVRFDDVGKMPARRLQVEIRSHDAELGHAMGLLLRQTTQGRTGTNIPSLANALNTLAPVFDLLVFGTISAVDDAEGIRAARGRSHRRVENVITLQNRETFDGSYIMCRLAAEAAILTAPARLGRHDAA